MKKNQTFKETVKNKVQISELKKFLFTNILKIVFHVLIILLKPTIFANQLIN